jgi:hypothetical protein
MYRCTGVELESDIGRAVKYLPERPKVEHRLRHMVRQLTLRCKNFLASAQQRAAALSLKMFDAYRMAFRDTERELLTAFRVGDKPQS